jgi:U3 small nucleolar ribonucleoprotein protein IMP4
LRLQDLIDACNSNDVTDLIVVHEHRGMPGAVTAVPTKSLSNLALALTDGLIVCHLPYGPTAHFSLINPVLRHDLKVPFQ